MFVLSRLETLMNYESSREVLGVLGGMGPLSSAEFLKTIYEYTLGHREQDSPVVLMYSDPSFPDRTTAFLAGEEDRILEQLVSALRKLVEMGATRVVMCCMTVHHLHPRLPDDLRAIVEPLPDIIYRQLASVDGRYLVVCSNGTRAFRLLERHPSWEVLGGRLVMPADEDQAVIHRDLIYPMKRAGDLDPAAAMLEGLLERYGVDGFVVGCSEVHILAKHFFSRERRHSCIDPFATVARELVREPAAL